MSYAHPSPRGVGHPLPAEADLPTLPGPVALARRARLRPGVVAAALLLLAAGLASLAAFLVLDGGILAFPLARLAREATWEVGPGEAPGLRFPREGPRDVRVGHARIPAFLDRLRDRGATVEAQARWSPALDTLVRDFGIFPPGPEADQAGLRVLDARGREMHRAAWPRSVLLPGQVPPLVADMVAYLENRELPDGAAPFGNPAVEWKRLAHAAANRLLRDLGLARPSFGGSTLAIQVEKFRHSPGGRTASVGEKARQIASATLRAYGDGPGTRGVRPRILRDWLNGLPLGARPGEGEVLGLGDGLRAWFGRDLADALPLLWDPEGFDLADPDGADRALAVRQALGLLLAQRRPAFYGGAGRAALEALVDAFARRMAADGVLSPVLRDRVLGTRLAFRERADPDLLPAGPREKARDAVRVQALQDLGLPDLYALERLDLDLQSTVDAALQDRVARTLRDLADPAFLAGARLRAPRLLGRGDPSGVVWSVSLYQRVGEASLLRAQVDGWDGPFSLGDGMKLELGSTAKLRVLVSYLEAVADLRDRLAAGAAAAPGDPLARWVAAWTRANPGAGLPDLLQAALDRRYRADPDEAFYTGGGLHRFANFRPEDDRTVPTVRQAFRQSVNLAFVRLLRDLVRHRVEAAGGPGTAVLADPAHPRRREYLERFADLEGRLFQQRFHEQWQALAKEDGAPPEGPPRGRRAPPDPLRDWTFDWLARHPGASLQDLLQAGAAARVAAYEWLYRPGRRAAQDRRIRDVLEHDAFAGLREDWARLGYPFPDLVPSLATALGASGDRPRALAELVGILQAGGMRHPVERVERWRFAPGTPYETVVRRPDDQGLRVLRAEVAEAVRAEMVSVVEAGTARRLKGAFRDAAGRVVPAGGKTGTGDNRYESPARGGRPATSRVVSRTATFAFFAGDRWFGVVTAHVQGPAAASYAFTSALPVAAARLLAPALDTGGAPPAGPPAMW